MAIIDIDRTTDIEVDYIVMGDGRCVYFAMNLHDGNHVQILTIDVAEKVYAALGDVLSQAKK